MAEVAAGQSTIPDLSKDEMYVLYGVSRKRKGFGYQVARKLEDKGYTFFIIHPDIEELDEWSPVQRLADLPRVPDAAILCSPASESRRILESLQTAGVARVYASWGTLDDTARDYAGDHGIQVIEECPLLHMRGLGFPHSLHRRILRLFRP